MEGRGGSPPGVSALQGSPRRAGLGAVTVKVVWPEGGTPHSPSPPQHAGHRDAEREGVNITEHHLNSVNVTVKKSILFLM